MSESQSKEVLCLSESIMNMKEHVLYTWQKRKGRQYLVYLNAVWLVHDFLREQEKHISMFCIYKSPFLPPAKLGVYGRKYKVEER